LDETVTEDDLHTLVGVFAKGAGRRADKVDTVPSVGATQFMSSSHCDETGLDADDIVIPMALRRQGGILSQPVFSRIKSETDMLRYLRGLADKDLALDRGMIPLGSCTM